MKVLVVSHACVLDVNQRIYRELSCLGHEVALVVPDRWRHLHSTGAFRPAKLADFSGPLVAVPVWSAGSGPLHAYVSPLAPIVLRFAPDLIYIEEERRACTGASGLSPGRVRC